MKTTLIILRPQPNQNTTIRLGLYKSDDTESRKDNPTQGLAVDLKDLIVKVDQPMLNRYNKYGSLICKDISDWIVSKGFENKESLLFEWWNEDGTDYYRFIGSAVEIRELFIIAEKKKRNSHPRKA